MKGILVWKLMKTSGNPSGPDSLIAIREISLDP
jgi:hypothetical protein